MKCIGALKKRPGKRFTPGKRGSGFELRDSQNKSPDPNFLLRIPGPESRTRMKCSTQALTTTLPGFTTLPERMHDVHTRIVL